MTADVDLARKRRELRVWEGRIGGLERLGASVFGRGSGLEQTLESLRHKRDRVATKLEVLERSDERTPAAARRAMHREMEDAWREMEMAWLSAARRLAPDTDSRASDPWQTA